VAVRRHLDCDQQILFPDRLEPGSRTAPELKLVPEGGYEPRWRADGHEIYYLSQDRKLMAVTVGPGPAFGVPEPLFQTRVAEGVSAQRTHYVPTRNGGRFLVNTQSGDPAPARITIVLNWTAGLSK
jgi:hypothetical protein